MPARVRAETLSGSARPNRSRCAGRRRVSMGGQSPRKHAQWLRTAEAVTMRWLLPHAVAQELRNQRQTRAYTAPSLSSAAAVARRCRCTPPPHARQLLRRHGPAQLSATRSRPPRLRRPLFADACQSPRRDAQRQRTADAITMRRLLPRVVAQEPRNRRESRPLDCSAPQLRRRRRTPLPPHAPPPHARQLFRRLTLASSFGATAQQQPPSATRSRPPWLRRPLIADACQQLLRTSRRIRPTSPSTTSSSPGTRASA